MGLLSRAAQEKSSQISSEKKGGLLAKASFQTESATSFQQWAKNNSFEHCGIFMPVSGMMVMMHAYQIDTNTIASSISSKVFWNKKLPENNRWYTYSNAESEFKDFLQFFDQSTAKHISSLSFLKFEYNGDFNVLMIFNTNSKFKPSDCSASFIESIIRDNKFSQISNQETCESLKHVKVQKRLVELPLEQIIKTAIENFELPEAKIKKCIITCIYEELFYILSNALDCNNICKYLDIYNIRLVLTVSEDTDNILLLSHIALLFSNIIPGLKPDSLKFIHSNSTDNIKEVQNFVN